MTHVVRHFGPLHITEYQDGYVEIEGVACGAMYFDSESFSEEDARRFSIKPDEVTCKKCRDKIDNGKCTSPEMNRRNVIHPHIASDPERYNVSNINLVRQACGLDPVKPNAATKALHIEALKKSIIYSERAIVEGKAEIARARNLESIWSDRTSKAEWLTDDKSRLGKHEVTVEGRTIHLWPLWVREYADGYTHAGETACALRSGGFDSESKDFRANEVNANPELVTCKKCQRSAKFREAQSLGTIWTSSHIEIIPRMRTAVLKHPELYDMDRNNELRDKLGLPTVYRDDRTRELLNQELALINERAASRIAHGMQEIKRKSELLAEMEGKHLPQTMMPPPIQSIGKPIAEPERSETAMKQPMRPYSRRRVWGVWFFVMFLLSVAAMLIWTYS